MNYESRVLVKVERFVLNFSKIELVAIVIIYSKDSSLNLKFQFCISFIFISS